MAARGIWQYPERGLAGDGAHHARELRSCAASIAPLAAGLAVERFAGAGNSRGRVDVACTESESLVAGSFARGGKPGSVMNQRKSELIPSFSRPPSRVLIRKVARYEEDLLAIIHESLTEFRLRIKDKTVLLKPNLVGLDPEGVMNTHPAVIAATRESFLKMGAARVLIGDGPAMDRDTEAILESVRLREFAGKLGRDFCDLNIDDVERVELKTRASRLKELFLPKTVLGDDFFVSMPKLKTHHWAGVTLAMKNLFGIVPGSCYGWPKNALHWAGIDRSILDINACVRPDFAIVDGIVAMEGNGPIQGQPKSC